MNFSDVFKSNFIETFDAIPFFDMALAMIVSFVIGMFIFYVYKKTYSGVMYSSSFGVTLIALSMITNLIILAVTSNIVLSLGMVGALSIVRFRTAIKEPSDIAFLFWSISVGIVTAAGLIPLALMGSILIGFMLIIFSKNSEDHQPYILIVHFEDQIAEENASQYVKESVKSYSIKSKSITEGNIEVNYEVRLSNADTTFINSLAKVPGVTYTVMVSYNGDYMS